MLGAAMATIVPKLYALPASHPCAAVAAALRLKRIEFQRIDLLPLTQLIVGPLRYGGHTVPGMRFDGERLVGSRAIMRRLDQLVPDPPLLPAPGSPAYARVLEAERWGDEVLQGVPRRVLDLAFVRRPAAMLSYAADAKLPLPLDAMRPAAPLVARLMARQNGAREEAVRADLAALPAQLQRIDGLDRLGPARRRAAERRRPADRQHRAAAAHDRRPAPVDRRTSRSRARALLPGDRRRSAARHVAGGVARAEHGRLGAALQSP